MENQLTQLNWGFPIFQGCFNFVGEKLSLKIQPTCVATTSSIRHPTEGPELFLKFHSTFPVAPDDILATRPRVNGGGGKEEFLGTLEVFFFFSGESRLNTRKGTPQVVGANITKRVKFERLSFTDMECGPRRLLTYKPPFKKLQTVLLLRNNFRWGLRSGKKKNRGIFSWPVNLTPPRNKAGLLNQGLMISHGFSDNKACY